MEQTITGAVYFLFFCQTYTIHLNMHVYFLSIKSHSPEISFSCLLKKANAKPTYTGALTFYFHRISLAFVHVHSVQNDEASVKTSHDCWCDSFKALSNYWSKYMTCIIILVAYVSSRKVHSFHTHFSCKICINCQAFTIFRMMKVMQDQKLIQFCNDKACRSSVPLYALQSCL